MASIAAAIQAGFYDIGLAGGVETMSTNPMAWDGGVNPKIADNPKAQDCLLPMGEPALTSSPLRLDAKRITVCFSMMHFKVALEGLASS